MPGFPPAAATAVNLILFEPGEASDGAVVRVSGPRAAHLLKVLKVAAGQRVRIGVVDGPTGTGLVEDVMGSELHVRCAFTTPPAERPRVDILLALPRPKVMRRLWAQFAALGVGRILLTNAERVERHYFDTHVLSPECYRALLVEGLQQARDTRLPAVSIHRRFRVLVEDELDGLCGTAHRLVAHPSASRSPIDALAAPRDTRVLLAVGPEGGWNEFELALLASRRFHRVGLGDRTLRSDTACIALVAVVHAALGAADTRTG